MTFVLMIIGKVTLPTKFIKKYMSFITGHSTQGQVQQIITDSSHSYSLKFIILIS